MLMRVWAPSAERVELVTTAGREQMTPVTGGYHEVEIELQPGDRYAYSIDGGDPRPDPRSNYQPDGPDGFSELVKHTDFEWNDLGWTSDPFEDWIVYELHVGTFTPEGTFDAAIDKLDHLVGLGINAIELMPVNTFPGDRGWGYDGVNLWAPHAAYGGPLGLKRLVDACHALDIAVILDVVYNHLGPSGNYLPEYGPIFTSTYATPWGDAINYDDAGSDGVRDFIVGNALYWLIHYHFDALRIDAIHAILDRSAKHILEEISERVEEIVERTGRPMYLIAESDLNDPRVITPRTRYGLGMDAQWSDDFHHALHSLLTGETDGYYADFGEVGHLATAFAHAYVYAGDYSPHRDRVHGREHGGAGGYRFLAYSQNHDQIGNRAAGERLCHLVERDAAKVAAALVLVSPYVPMLFMGEEWAASTPFQYFTSHPDPDLGRAVSEGRRNEFKAFGWDPAEVPDPQAESTFEASRLNWEEVANGDHAEMLNWYRALIELRKSEPKLRTHDLSNVTVDFDEDARWIAVFRNGITTVANLGHEVHEIAAAGELLLASNDEVHATGDSVKLPPLSVAILRG